ncbi:hypothetical protein ACFPN2_28350 [Steroidobacter flavus]|uniref:Amidase n=1 Tax=Steroidobacter flavus TaxID=1842136 RepID=A0ABV8T2B9_9GAMM
MDWVHPKDARGRYIPLLDGADYLGHVRRWEEEAAKWQEGLEHDLGSDEWRPIPEELRALTYAEYVGERPDPQNYMPRWSETECLGYQMYEEVTDGTPLSPVCRSPEELARWLVDHGANAFAGTTANYDEWLYVARGGRAGSAAVSSGEVVADFRVHASSGSP